MSTYNKPEKRSLQNEGSIYMAVLKSKPLTQNGQLVEYAF